MDDRRTAGGGHRARADADVDLLVFAAMAVLGDVELSPPQPMVATKVARHTNNVNRDMWDMRSCVVGLA